MSFESQALKQHEDNRERLEPGMEYLRERLVERIKANQKVSKEDLLLMIDNEIYQL